MHIRDLFVSSVVFAAMACFAVPTAFAQYFPDPGQRPARGVGADPEFWPYQDRPQEHDRGFFLRGFGGLAYSWSRGVVDEFDGDAYEDPIARVDGGGFLGSVAVGGIVAPNIALHGTATYIMAISPSANVLDQPIDADVLGLSLLGIGPGVTFYTPINVYISGTLGASILQYNLDTDAPWLPDMDVGLYYELMFGKEWWVNARTGLGIGGVIAGHRVGSSDIDAFRGPTIGVGLSVTFN